MRKTTVEVNDDILAILGECRIEGNIVYLPNRQLDRETYQAVNQVFENIGGKWNRKARGHMFPNGDPTELLGRVMRTGETTNYKQHYQFFPTPRPIAERMCRLAKLDRSSRVLEPSCGRGDLADVIYERGVAELHGVELNPDMERLLREKPYSVDIGVDFLKWAKTAERDRWNRIIMNPPFTRQQDIDHILAAYDLLMEGGILVSVVSEGAFSNKTRKPTAFRGFLEERKAEVIRLDEGAFSESGTMIRSGLIKIRKRAAEGA